MSRLPAELRPLHRLPSELETLEAYELMEQALEERRVVDVSFFQEHKTKRFRDELPRVQRMFGKRPMLTASPVRRLVEPVEPPKMTMDGAIIVVVISHSSPGEELPAPRAIRLDRIAVGPRGLRLKITKRPYLVAGTGLDPTVTHVPKRPEETDHAVC